MPLGDLFGSGPSLHLSPDPGAQDTAEQAVLAVLHRVDTGTLTAYEAAVVLASAGLLGTARDMQARRRDGAA